MDDGPESVSRVGLLPKIIDSVSKSMSKRESKFWQNLKFRTSEVHRLPQKKILQQAHPLNEKFGRFLKLGRSHMVGNAL